MDVSVLPGIKSSELVEMEVAPTVLTVLDGISVELLLLPVVTVIPSVLCTISSILSPLSLSTSILIESRLRVAGRLKLAGRWPSSLKYAPTLFIKAVLECVLLMSILIRKIFITVRIDLTSFSFPKVS